MNNHTQVQKVQPTGIFTNYIFKALPLAFDESMSYYECLCNLLDYLKNTVIPTINTNADAIIELQNNVDSFEENMNESFTEFTTSVNNTVEELETYMNNYFDNLDVQDEINNKMDQMVLDGTMDQLLNTNLTGSLSDLTTTDKSNLVSAINEVNGNTITNANHIGNLSNLNTSTKTDLVSAINEVNSLSDTPTIIGKWNVDGEVTDIYRVVISLGDLTDPTRYDQNNSIRIPTGISGTIKPVNMTFIGGDGVYWQYYPNILDPDNDGHLSWFTITLLTDVPNGINTLFVDAMGNITRLIYEKECYLYLDYRYFEPEPENPE